MARLDDLVEKEGRMSLRWPAVVAALLICSFVAWAAIAKLDEVAIATGRIVPVGQVKVIQHLEGGIIEQLLVKEGDRVKQGKALVRLNLGALGLNKGELQVQLDGQLLILSRLKSLADAKPLKLPTELVKTHPALAANERRLYVSRKAELASRLATLEEQARQRSGEVRELMAQDDALRRDLLLSREKAEIANKLREEKLVSRMEHLRLKQEVQRLEGRISVIAKSIARARIARREISRAKTQERARARRNLDEEVAQSERDIAGIKERLQRAKNQAGRTLIKSPIDGVVKNLRYHTIGGVVRPGDPIMEVVPTSGALIVEAFLKTTDRAYVEIGQTATVKVSSYDFVRYGGLTGNVVTIAADTNISENGTAFYKVLIETSDVFIDPFGNELPISAGMEAVVDIHTGQRTVLEYLIKPILKMRAEAFRER